MKKLFTIVLALLILLLVVSTTFASVQDISNLTKLIKSVEDGSVFNTLSSVSRITGTENEVGQATISTINLYWPTISIVDQFGSGINLDNATYVYINFLRINDALGSYFDN